MATCADLDVDPDSPLLVAALAEAGVAGTLVAWDDPAVDWDDFDLVVVRSTWDYPTRVGDFLAWARGVARLANPYEVLAYSSDKHYLADLAARGLPVVTSRYCDVGDEIGPFDGDVVIKPCVGAGSIDAARYDPNDYDGARAHVARLHALGRDVLVQPYVDSVDETGEYAVIFIDGTFSHAITKGALLNVEPDERDALFRREQISAAARDPMAVDVAAAILAAKGYSDLLYARVDLVRDDHGWALLELELVEPSLFLTFDDGAARHLAEAIARRC